MPVSTVTVYSTRTFNARSEWLISIAFIRQRSRLATG